MSDTAQQILITRIFDAPRELVFAAWTDADQVARWFGPEGIEVARESVVIELRVGGRFELSMGHFDLKYEIAELDPPRLLVLTCEPMGTVTRIELHDHGDKTRMTLSDGPYTEARHAEAGWHGAFAKLDALLAS